jgi:hypothetical protein
MRKLILSVGTSLTIMGCIVTSRAQVLLDVETGAISTEYSDVRIPGNQGTLFSLKDDLKSKTELFYRIRMSYTMNSRHTLSVLYAPLQTQSEGSTPKNITFEGGVFPANTELVGIYKFNSYRMTYRYDILKKSRFELGLGFTAKIRDAKISLASSDLYAEKTNVGFVPIINFRLLYQINDQLGILLDGDALAAPQGRAEDIILAVTYKHNERLGIRAGYRILEGGADGNEVYNFALFHYASFGINYVVK